MCFKNSYKISCRKDKERDKLAAFLLLDYFYMQFSHFILFFTTNLLILTQVKATNLPENIANETSNRVMAGDKYITLLGTQLVIGDLAPNFKVVDKNFSPVQLSDFKDKIVFISVIPSLDTAVCSLQTKRFNDEIAKTKGDIVDEIAILSISNDLPFAQKRFCSTEGIDKINVLSDSVWRDFGLKYGLLIKDMGLLTRAIFIIDKKGKLIYKELVANISEQPNYEKSMGILLQAVAEKTNKP
jgi:thioredoxin-dependent peroxiredoxin